MDLILQSEPILRENLTLPPETPGSVRIARSVACQSGNEKPLILHMAVSIEPQTESLEEPVASREMAISCLARLGAQNGIDIEIETVRRRTARDGDSLTVSRLIKLADEFGLQAEWSRLDWHGLKTTGFNRALLVFWANSNAVVLTGGGAPAPRRSASRDPHHDGVTFYVPREEFERT